MASLSGNNTIVLKAGYTEGGAEHEEGPLAAAALPGMNMVMSQAFGVNARNTWTPGASTGVGTGTNDIPAAAPVRVLKEDALQGKTVNDAYAAGDNGFIHIAKSGDVIQVLVAAGQTFVKAQGLSAIASGKWNVDAVTAAVETLERSGAALAADTLVKVRVL